MALEVSNTATENQAKATEERGGDPPDRNGEPRSPNPYLKVFGPDIGVLEVELHEKPVTVGRADDADIRLPHPEVSRAHARITYDHDRYTLEDVGSSHGTIVNRQRVSTHPLTHGDSVQIGPYVIQFRTHHPLPGAAAAAERAQRLLHSQFSTLPSGIRCQYRTLEVAPQAIFQSGDTLRIGQSGLLIPTSAPPDDGACLDVLLAWSSDRKKRYLGEIVGVLEEQSMHWICVKLHTVSSEVHQATVDDGQPGPWVEAVST